MMKIQRIQKYKAVVMLPRDSASLNDENISLCR